MPHGTPVDDMYQALRREGHDEGSAARIAQARTGLALATGKPPKHKNKKAASFEEALAKAGAIEALSAGGVKERRRRGGPSAMSPASNIDVAAAKSFADALAKGYPEYNPDQSRDYHGRFADEGGGGGGSGSAPGVAVRRDLFTVANNLNSISTPQEARDSIERSTSIRTNMTRLPQTAWHDPTGLDHAWHAYLITVTSIAALAAVGVVLAATAASGVMIAGAHTHPFQSAFGAGMMATLPKFWANFSYTTARRYLTTLFPGEGKALRVAMRVAPMVAAGVAGVGAVLASALALRYAYRQISTNGEYLGVSSINRRLEMLDSHISALTSSMRGDIVPNATPHQTHILPFIQSGLAIGASLVALAGAAKLGTIAYRVAKMPKVPVGAWEGWGSDLRSLFGGLGSDVGRAARGARSAASRVKRPRTS